MSDLNHVYRAIKDISGRSFTPRPFIMITSVAAETGVAPGLLLPLIMELSHLRLIQVIGKPVESLRLTLLGNMVTRG